MNKTEEQSGMTMEQMEEAGKIEEKKRDAEAAVAQSEAASKKRREGKRVRVPVRFKKPLDSSSPNYRNLTLAMERDGFAEPLVEGSYPSFEVLIYEDDLELLDKFCGVKGLDILDHRMEELPESRSATTIVGDFSLELLLKAIREANPGCFVTGKQVHGKVQDPMMKVFRVLCVVRGPPVWPSVVAGRRPIFAGERSEQFENVPGKTVIVLRPAGCRSVADVMRWFATSGLTAPDQIKLKDRDLDSGRWDGASSSAFRPTRRVGGVGMAVFSRVFWWAERPYFPTVVGVVCLADVSLSPGWTECFASEVGPRLILRISDIWPLRCLSDRLVRWKILLWDVADAARSLGERMWPLILLRLVKGSLVIVLSFPGMGLMGAPMPASTKPRMNGQLWTTSEGLVVTLGPVKGQRSNQDLNTRSGKPHRVVRGKPDGDNLKKEENPAVGTTSRGIAGRHRLGGDGHDGGKPQEGDNLKKEENPAVGDNLKGIAGRHRLGGDGHGGETPGDNSRRRKPAEGDNLMREGAEGEPQFWENLDGGMEDDAGDGNAAQAGDIGAYYFGSGGWGWLRTAYDPLSFGSALGTGRFGKGDWLGYHGCK
ncbi:hypothetical protein PAPYR_13176 [Paratrimastix pyriformis]|uniref:Uncharacterized protein n=1 Tax=Paratrimastix pyriformis TaxID=342808 RepID=A0ABQ8U483_9EUKA|nr:hypothetical protein PAPYR_13176 [Paratrimastix pyriformis]